MTSFENFEEFKEEWPNAVLDGVYLNDETLRELYADGYDLGSIESYFMGSAPSFGIWVVDYVDDLGLLNMESDAVRYNFDYEAFGHDLLTSGDIIAINQGGVCFVFRSL